MSDRRWPHRRQWFDLIVGRLPWVWWGRRVQPLALATMLSMATLVWALADHLGVGDLLGGQPGHCLAVISAAAALMLAAGWWLRNQWLLTHGLLISSGVWAGVASILMVDIGWEALTAFAWCWWVAITGAFLLEADGRGGRSG